MSRDCLLNDPLHRSRAAQTNPPFFICIFNSDIRKKTTPRHVASLSLKAGTRALNMGTYCYVFIAGIFGNYEEKFVHYPVQSSREERGQGTHYTRPTI